MLSSQNGTHTNKIHKRSAPSGVSDKKAGWAPSAIPARKTVTTPVDTATAAMPPMVQSQSERLSGRRRSRSDNKDVAGFPSARSNRQPARINVAKTSPPSANQPIIGSTPVMATNNAWRGHVAAQSNTAAPPKARAVARKPNGFISSNSTVGIQVGLTVSLALRARQEEPLPQRMSDV